MLEHVRTMSTVVFPTWIHVTQQMVDWAELQRCSADARFITPDSLWHWTSVNVPVKSTTAEIQAQFLTIKKKTIMLYIMAFPYLHILLKHIQYSSEGKVIIFHINRLQRISALHKCNLNSNWCDGGSQTKIRIKIKRSSLNFLLRLERLVSCLTSNI